MKHTKGEWRIAEDAQGACMVMHPTREGVAIASLTDTFNPTNGFHEDWMVYNDDKTVNEEATRERIEERNANALLIAAAPELLEALQYYNEGVDHFYKCLNFAKSNLDAKAIQFMNESNMKIRDAIAKATQPIKQ